MQGGHGDGCGGLRVFYQNLWGNVLLNITTRYAISLVITIFTPVPNSRCQWVLGVGHNDYIVVRKQIRDGAHSRIHNSVVDHNPIIIIDDLDIVKALCARHCSRSLTQLTTTTSLNTPNTPPPTRSRHAAPTSGSSICHADVTAIAFAII